MKKRRKKKKNKIILPIIIIIILIIIGLFLFNKKYQDKNKLNITLINNLDIEINSKTNLLSCIKDIKNGEILTEDSTIDTSKLGKQNLEILLKDNFNKEKKYSFEINIVDTTKPTIEYKENISSYVGKEINLLKDITVTVNSKEEIKAIIEGTYDINKVGEYKLRYVAKDSSGNETKKDFTLSIISDPNNYTFTTSKGYTAKVINGITYIDGILIANKSYSLPSSYGSGLTKETLSAFNQMDADATALGLNLYISSGYRSYYDQKYIYNNYVKRDGQANADTYSARAGHSEHQTGLAFDLYNGKTVYTRFEETKEFDWMQENAYKYGFILRFPKDKEKETGYVYEAWHYRYVGKEIAKEIKEKNISLEEYIATH
jgi:D-alanyl-D-alanine carboxypeptidase